MDPIRLSGLASSMDTESIITKLMSLERLPLQQEMSRASDLTASRAAWDDVSMSMSSLKAAADNLAQASLWSGRVAASSDSTSVAVASSGTPPASSYKVSVTTVAQAESVQSSTFSSETDARGLQGSVSIGGKPVTIATTDSLDAIRDKINAAGAGVTASVLQVSTGQFSLVVQSNATGTAAAAAYGDDATFTPLKSLGLLTGGGTKNVVLPAVDAQFAVNGVTFTRGSNTVSDALSGLTLNLKAPTSSPLTLTVSNDTASISGAITDFANKFNALIDKLSNNTAKGGALEADPTAVALSQRLVTMAMNGVSGLPSSMQNLSQAGGTIDRNGHLSVDSAKLNTALTSNLAGVAALFTKATSGLGTSFSSLLDSYTKSGGSVANIEQSYDKQLQSLNAHKDALNRALAVRENNLRREFTNMEQVVSNLRNQGNWMLSQLGGMSTSSSGSPGAGA